MVLLSVSTAMSGIHTAPVTMVSLSSPANVARSIFPVLSCSDQNKYLKLWENFFSPNLESKTRLKHYFYIDVKKNLMFSLWKSKKFKRARWSGPFSVYFVFTELFNKVVKLIKNKRSKSRCWCLICNTSSTFSFCKKILGMFWFW